MDGVSTDRKETAQPILSGWDNTAEASILITADLITVPLVKTGFEGQPTRKSEHRSFSQIEFKSLLRPLPVV